MRLLLVGQAYKLILQQGPPPIWPWNWAALQGWLARAAPSSTLHYLFLGMLFSAMRPLVLVPFVVAVPAAYEVLQYLSVTAAGNRLWQAYGSRARAVMNSKQVLHLALLSVRALHAFH